MDGMFVTVSPQIHSPHSMGGYWDAGNGEVGFGGFRSWLKHRWGRGLSVKGLKSSIRGTAHTAGAVLDNKYVKGALATGLALTGVGLPAAAGIMAAEGAVGGTLKKGGGLKNALRGAGRGAIIGAAAGEVGKIGFVKHLGQELHLQKPTPFTQNPVPLLPKLPPLPKVSTIPTDVTPSTLAVTTAGITAAGASVLKKIAQAQANDAGTPATVATTSDPLGQNTQPQVVAQPSGASASSPPDVYNPQQPQMLPPMTTTADAPSIPDASATDTGAPDSSTPTQAAGSGSLMMIALLAGGVLLAMNHKKRRT